jgi:aryl-alcohol dehydrogenase-like predicted oxidoreductase
MELAPLGNTGIHVSRLGLGTVKFGRNEQVKYPRPFALPDDEQIRSLLDLAADLGINMLDTAPAYGSSMQRLGALLGGARERWVIVSKVGEFFEHGRSRFDFSYSSTIATVEDSLRTLRTDYLDVVLIHSDGDDLRILEQEAVLDALRDLKRRGLIRAHGMSSKSVAGGLRAVAETDVVMVTLNPAYDDEIPVIAAAKQRGKGVLIKKGLQSGHLAGVDGVREAMRLIFSQPGVAGLVVGTLNPAHLRANVASLEAVLAMANGETGLP